MEEDIVQVLSRWAATAGATEIRRITDPQSFSKARVWRVSTDGRNFALRDWGGSWGALAAADRIPEIHSIQLHLASHLPDLIPHIETTVEGTTVVLTRFGQCSFELASWMPGAVVGPEDLDASRLTAAMRALADVHSAGVRQPADDARTLCPWLWAARERYAGRRSDRLRSVSPAMRNRFLCLEDLSKRKLSDQDFWDEIPAGELPLVREVMGHLNYLAPIYMRLVKPWVETEMAMEPCHGDARLENVLFIGDSVSGVLDFGAAGLDSHALDVARLLGSAAGDDDKLRRLGMQAYLDARMLPDIEVATVDIYDRAGVVVAAHRWIGWLRSDPTNWNPPRSREVCANRLQGLAKRLRSIRAHHA